MTVPVPASQQASEAAAIVRAALSHASLDDPWGLNPERYRNSISAGKAALAELVSLAARTEEAEALAESRLEDIFYQLGQVVAYTERAEAAERERDEAFGKIDRLNDEANDLGHDCERAEARSAKLEEALRRVDYFLSVVTGDGYPMGESCKMHARGVARAALAPAPAEETTAT